MGGGDGKGQQVGDEGAGDLPAVAAVEKGPAQPAAKRGRIFCITGGTRGDQQPMVMIAAQLKKMGFGVTLFIGEEGADWVEEYGFDWIKIANWEDLMTNNKDCRMAAQTGSFPQMMKFIMGVKKEIHPAEFKLLDDALRNTPDLVGIIGSTIHVLTVQVLARKMGVYGGALFMQPNVPTGEYPPVIWVDSRNPSTWQQMPSLDGCVPGPFAEVQELTSDVNRQLWVHCLTMMKPSQLLGLKGAIDMFKAQDLFPKDDAQLLELAINIWKVQRGKSEATDPNIDWLLAYGDILLPSDATDLFRSCQVGYVFDSGVGGMSPFSSDVEEFLQKGEPPVFIGWGSMSIENNSDLIRAAVGACQLTGRRGIILSGWAHRSLDMLDADADAGLLDYAAPGAGRVMVVGKVNQAWLFPRCCCAVTHGGAGTTAALLRGGRPCVVTPSWGDQNFMGDRIEAAGVGRRGPHISTLTAENLAALVTEVLTTPSFAETARRVGAELRGTESGDVVAARRIAAQVEARRAREAAKRAGAAV